MTKLNAITEYFFGEGVTMNDVAPSDWLWIASLPVAGVVALVTVISGM